MPDCRLRERRQRAQRPSNRGEAQIFQEEENVFKESGVQSTIAVRGTTYRASAAAHRTPLSRVRSRPMLFDEIARRAARDLVEQQRLALPRRAGHRQ